jgi:hypothetical protein
MQSTEYVEYLLKNYHGIMREIQQMKIELEYFSAETPDETIEGMVLGAHKLDAVPSGKMNDRTGCMAVMYREASARINATSRKRIEAVVKTCELELKKLMLAMDSLDEQIRKVVRDLYITRLSWRQVCSKYYISHNTLNRYRVKGIREIAQGFTGTFALAGAL